MNHNFETIKDSVETLADDARALLSATADIAEEKVVAARKRLAAALNSTKDMYEHLSERVAQGVERVDKTIREHPYADMAVAAGAGVLIGLWLGSCGRDFRR